MITPMPRPSDDRSNAVPAPASPAGGLADAPATLRSVRRLADLLDTAFVVPGTNIRFGLDAILGLVPVLGDTLTAGLGLLPVIAASKLGLGKGLAMRMLGNLFVDWLVGLIPVVDIFFDVAFKANIRNLKLLEEALEARRR